MSLDILFLTRLFPREKEQEIKKKMKTGMQDAANALQWNIIDGIEENGGEALRILNYLPVDAYPNGYTDKFIEEFTFDYKGEGSNEDLNVGCCNIFGIKRFINSLFFRKHLKRWAKEKTDKKKVFLCYTATTFSLGLARLCKKYNKNVETACIIADIPEFATARQMTGIKEIYRKYQVKRCARLYDCIDKYVLLTDQMAGKLNISSPYMVMEGIATTENKSHVATDKKERYVLYTGTLNFGFGIKVLLDAFTKIENKDAKLKICGFGEAEQMIKEMQATDNRIDFRGKVDRSEALRLQRNATVLVNPRQNNEEFTKYSFPSKNLEYLSSGVPLVAYKLDGIPREYDEYIIYPADDSPEELARKLDEILDMPEGERASLGARAKDFVYENKNKKVQAKRVLDFLQK